MAVNINEIFRRGGVGLIDLLEFSVISVKMDPVFVFLVQEYKSNPTTMRAVSLYELFCAPKAPAKISADHVLPPKDLRIQRAVQPIRQQLLQAQGANSGEQESIVPRTIPGNHLFDFIVDELQNSPEGSVTDISHQFDPSRSPSENLPGGKMNSAQRTFVQGTWEAYVRPQLVAVGFRRIANIA